MSLRTLDIAQCRAQRRLVWIDELKGMARADQITNDFLMVVPAGGFFLLTLLYIAVQVQQEDSKGLLGAIALAAAFGVGCFTIIRKMRYQGRLMEVPTAFDAQQSRDVLRTIVGDKGWALVVDEADHLIVETPPTWFTWGQEITVIFDEGMALVNSRNRSFFARTPLSFGNNRKHIAMVRQALAAEQVESGF